MTSAPSILTAEPADCASHRAHSAPVAPAEPGRPELAAALSALAPLLDDHIAAGADTARQAHQRLNVDPADVRKGLGQLVLTLVQLIHELLERQAIRRMDAGDLTPEQADAVGTTLMLQTQEIENLCTHFGLDRSDLTLDLGPLGRLL